VFWLPTLAEAQLSATHPQGTKYFYVERLNRVVSSTVANIKRIF